MTDEITDIETAPKKTSRREETRAKMREAWARRKALKVQQMAKKRPSEEKMARAEPVEDARLVTKSATGMVTVGCKVPNGLRLQLSVFENTTEPVMGGGHKNVKIARKQGPIYDVRGPAVKFGEIPKFLIAGGYALTSGIPEDFWNEWLKQNSDAVIVERELIVAYKDVADVEAHCRNNESLLTGLEPIDPQRLPRGIQQAPEQTARR